MRYLDLDHAAPSSQPLQPQRAKPRWQRFGKLILLVGFLSALVFAGYSLFWPASATLADIFKAPAAVLSFIRAPEQDLKSTNGRTNFLLLGIDRRSDEPYSYKDRQGRTIRSCFRADTLVVASVNLKDQDKDVVFISIPRDLWIRLPGWTAEGGSKVGPQSAKVNATYCYGDRDGYPSGYGLGLARDTLAQILDLPIHYALRIDFYGFKKSVEAVGGISVKVDNSFVDCSYPIEGQEDNPVQSKRYKCVSFKAGYQYMDAETALTFVRSRHGTGGEGSDLARALRQQKILLAIRDKALTLPTFTDPLKLSNLIKALDETLQTLDIDFSQVGQFFKLAQSVNVGSAENIVFTSNPGDEAGLLKVPSPELYGGAFVFIPRLGEDNYREIQSYVRRKLAEANLLPEATPSARPGER
ncbi:MAG TPA: LCP family protein [Patescibacteria group bacterium]|nr:LCP family protein [Patescibacteria group bacterium]